ncbi:hypothetical protein P0D80_49770 [Paraburkholderia sp. RL17-373-BIF-A]
MFTRLAQGWYQFNPALAVRRRDASDELWVPLHEALNVRLVAESADPRYLNQIDALLDSAHLAPLSPPIVTPERPDVLKVSPLTVHAPGPRTGFSVGEIVSFTDKALQTRTGTIVRLNQKTATITCPGTERHWRVSYALLRQEAATGRS